MSTSWKQRIPQRLSGQATSWLRAEAPPGVDDRRGRPRAIVALAGLYQNLGDMALTYAQVQMLEETLPEFQIVLVPSAKTYSYARALRRTAVPGDVVTLIGGGNMDDLYSSLEECRRHVVRTFADHPVISFPQTMSFSDTRRGRRELRRSRRVYAAHPDLQVFAREHTSLERMRRQLTGVRTSFAPDTVLGLRTPRRELLRAGILLCIRDDAESKLSVEQRRHIADAANTAFPGEVEVRDTVDVTLEECRPETFRSTVDAFLDLLRTKSLVVTDRLHCMIFCALTGTPCIVLPNANHKVKGVFDAALSAAPHIVLSTSVDRTVQLITGSDGIRPPTASEPVRLDSEYAALRDALTGAARGAER